MRFHFARIVRATIFGSGVPVALRGIRHLVAGGTGTLLYIGLVAILIELVGLHPVTAILLSFPCLLVYTYLVNRTWVFQSKGAHWQLIPKFIVVTLVSLFLNVGIMHLVVDVAHFWYGWGLFLATLIVPITNFILGYVWAFR